MFEYLGDLVMQCFGCCCYKNQIKEIDYCVDWENGGQQVYWNSDGYKGQFQGDCNSMDYQYYDGVEGI